MTHLDQNVSLDTSPCHSQIHPLVTPFKMCQLIRPRDTKKAIRFRIAFLQHSIQFCSAVLDETPTLAGFRTVLE